MIMRKSLIIYLLIFAGIMLFSASSCNKGNVNPNVPIVNIDISFDPNSTLFYELNVPGGWAYIDDKPGVYIPFGSRGIIVYRMDMNTFNAYERTPPNDPNHCCDDQKKNCTKLIVGDNYPFVVDTCLDNKYNILDGSLFEGTGSYPLIQYRADYDGYTLHIYN